MRHRPSATEDGAALGTSQESVLTEAAPSMVPAAGGGKLGANGMPSKPQSRSTRPVSSAWS
eukprot:CAMPEP_0172796012 /NCGR_PEP_ID=MMETSP1074-20121228/210772_1 /TAXON_ID=2916 /ORGANISM="Ceratium fusus, Strain PA161109" /LENGTH=60 /DNA_ID=CAMNT_0013633103 /DNA_START=154 /DNA_END=336 /DNA_ORIENTATION=-